MTVRIAQTVEVQKFFEDAAGFTNDGGNARMKTVIHRVLNDTAKILSLIHI